RRAVSPREHRVRERPHDPEEFSRPRGCLERSHRPARKDTLTGSVMDDFKALIGKVATGATLSRDEAANAFDHMMSGEATPSQMGGLLMGLRLRGETVDEITGAVTT